MYSITKNRSCRAEAITRYDQGSRLLLLHFAATPIHHCIVIQRMQNSHPEVLEQFKKEVLEEGILHEADTLGAEDETLL